MQQLKAFHDEYRKLEAELFAKDLSNELAALAKQSLQWAYFERVDSFADNNPNGPYWLKDDRGAKLVADSLHFLAKEKIDLWCYCIMSNHVHALFNVRNDEDDLFRVMQQHKSFTAKEANRFLSLSGQFWERESYDHVVRAGEFWRIVHYILNNPVKAGLVSSWDEWKWAYLNPVLK